VDPRAGLDDVERRKFLTLSRPARSQSLYRLSYLGSYVPFTYEIRGFCGGEDVECGLLVGHSTVWQVAINYSKEEVVRSFYREYRRSLLFRLLVAPHHTALRHKQGEQDRNASLLSCIFLGSGMGKQGCTNSNFVNECIRGIALIGICTTTISGLLCNPLLFQPFNKPTLRKNCSKRNVKFSMYQAVEAHRLVRRRGSHIL
jgi:hypothetical protein